MDRLAADLMSGIRPKTKISLKLKGKNIEMPNIEMIKFKYTKRTEKATAALRRDFNTTGRKDFLQNLGKDEALLKKKGFSDNDIAKIKNGRVPDGYQVHHKYPLDDSGTNNLDNLVLIKNEPYHKAITAHQRTVTHGMQPGDSRIVDWPVIDGNIYP
jgi:hypothetical protein